MNRNIKVRIDVEKNTNLLLETEELFLCFFVLKFDRIADGVETLF